MGEPEGFVCEDEPILALGIGVLYRFADEPLDAVYLACEAYVGGPIRSRRAFYPEREVECGHRGFL